HAPPDVPPLSLHDALPIYQDTHQRVLVQRVQRHHHRQTADELGNHAVLEQVLRHDLPQQIPDGLLLPALDVRAEADGLLADAPLDDFLQPVERAAADEQNVGRVDLDKLLVRVL